MLPLGAILVKRLLPSGVCARASGLNVGDRLIECNGHSLRNLTQSQCLDVLKSAGPSVSLTVLHLVKEGDGGDSSQPVPPRRKSKDEPSTDGDGDAQDKTVYKTDITVTSPKSASVTAIQFDTSVSQPVANISVPPGAVKLTTQGITKDPKSDPSTQDDGEEEEIKPMMVHRDHQGNKLATPSPPETLGRQTMEPRRLDESAKRDLQSIMSEMNKNVRGVPVVKNGVANGDFSDSVQEDEIVPVKLTRKEAETAEKVLSNWVSGEKKSPASPSSSPKKSAFQKAVGTMIDVQSGKKELPADSVFFTTIGITKAPKDKQNGQVEEEEEIKPMTLHKDHLGNKYFAPSPPESLGKQSGIRKLDEAVKQDIAAVMSSMSAKPTQSSPSRVSQGKDKDVEEDSIVPTVLSREDARTAMSVLAKWATGESAPKSTPSSFQRLVGNVLDSKASDDTAPGKTVHASLVNVVKESEDSAPAPPHVAQDKADDDQRSSVPELKKEETVKATLVMLDTSPDPTKTDDASSEPAKDTEAPASAAQADASPSKQTPAEEFQKSKPPPPEVKPKPTPPLEVKSKLGLSERRNTSSLLSSSKAAKPEYAKSRTEDAPFLVEVLKGIVGLGIKVVVTPDGHVQVTEVQRNSPVDKNGNVK
nr:hypothetical protein BaRGS_012153 [Batillaria attramentaria]